MCPHCDQELQAFKLPDAANFEAEFHLACFNDECPYYVRGWEHLESNYAVKASYRYRVEPITGKASPLAVWSANAVKDCIIGASVDESDPSDDKPEKPNNGGCP